MAILACAFLWIRMGGEMLFVHTCGGGYFFGDGAFQMDSNVLEHGAKSCYWSNYGTQLKTTSNFIRARESEQEDQMLYSSRATAFTPRNASYLIYTGNPIIPVQPTSTPSNIHDANTLLTSTRSFLPHRRPLPPPMQQHSRRLRHVHNPDPPRHILNLLLNLPLLLSPNLAHPIPHDNRHTRQRTDTTKHQSDNTPGRKARRQRLRRRARALEVEQILGIAGRIAGCGSV